MTTKAKGVKGTKGVGKKKPAKRAMRPAVAADLQRLRELYKAHVRARLNIKSTNTKRVIDRLRRDREGLNKILTEMRRAALKMVGVDKMPAQPTPEEYTYLAARGFIAFMMSTAADPIDARAEMERYIGTLTELKKGLPRKKKTPQVNTQRAVE